MASFWLPKHPASHCLDTVCSRLQQTFPPNDSLKSFLAEQPSLRRYQALRN